jgi:nitroreductase
MSITNNAAYENLLTRCSVRSFTDKKVDEELVDALIAAGQAAPTGRGLQKTAFVAIEEPALLAEVEKLNQDARNKPQLTGAAAHPFYGAPLAIAVLADGGNPTWMQDGCAALENILLAASALDLGSCWINRALEVFETEQGKQWLKDWDIPESYKGVGFAVVGYTEAPETEKSKRTSIVRKLL